MPLIPFTSLTYTIELHAEYPEYRWFPQPLSNATHSAERLDFLYQSYLFENPEASKSDLTSYIRDSITTGLGIQDATSDEISALVESPATSLYLYADMMSRRSQTGWSTHGHSAADVNIYSSDPKIAWSLVGNHENTEVGDFLRNYLDLDVDAITKELRDKGVDLLTTEDGKEVSWMGPVPEEGQRLDGQNHLASYGGDFKKRHLLHGRGCDCGH